MAAVEEVLIKRFGQYPVSGCHRAATEEHHVLYDYHQGGPVVRRLCKEHHGWITRHQAHAARRQHHEVTDKQRWRFWYELVEGRMKRLRRTSLDAEWAEEP